MSTIALFLIVLVVILLFFAGVGIKTLIKKNGEFKRRCTGIDPYTNKGGGCACAERAEKVCDSRQRHPYQPLEVNSEMMKEMGVGIPERNHTSN
ncbi:MAG: hypothetical protein K5842_03450 [Bacteroidales bacterium]|nr:hypothetical protein [Bacteroidales bacterium]